MLTKADFEKAESLLRRSRPCGDSSLGKEHADVAVSLIDLVESPRRSSGSEQLDGRRVLTQTVGDGIAQGTVGFELCFVEELIRSRLMRECGV